MSAIMWIMNSPALRNNLLTSHALSLEDSCNIIDTRNDCNVFVFVYISEIHPKGHIQVGIRNRVTGNS